MTERHLITCELAPSVGGVAAYTWNLATALCDAGESIHVWCPAMEQTPRSRPNLAVHAELGALTRHDLKRAGDLLDRYGHPARLLVQWVPHGYRRHAMNLPFCAWLWSRARRGDLVEIMVHEPFLGFRAARIRRDIVACVHRLMTIMLLRAASAVWIAIPAWEDRWRPYALGKSVPFRWLPIPSTIDPVDDVAGVQAVRRRYTTVDTPLLIGHLGTDAAPISTLLEWQVPRVLDRRPGRQVLLIGKGSEHCKNRIVRDHPAIASQLHATGILPARQVSMHLQACDLMLQPYPDGVSTRRTTAMAALAHGCPVVTASGPLTESIWAEHGAVCLAGNDPAAVAAAIDALEANDVERQRVARAARALYDKRFALRHTVDALRDAA